MRTLYMMLNTINIKAIYDVGKKALVIATSRANDFLMNDGVRDASFHDMMKEQWDDVYVLDNRQQFLKEKFANHK